MIDQISFQTAARTVDHLGREQIADAPTAVSELWKNAFDAYATSVELNIYHGDRTVAALLDDGHGMSRQEFITRWLVVGTESKLTSGETPIEDRVGLPIRPKQGQKGIGRLSCANLGGTLLVVTKRSRKNFVAALVDWRLFENPYLTLDDVRLPVTEFAAQEELFGLIPSMTRQLLENVTGGGGTERVDRIVKAWADYDALQAKRSKSDWGTSLRAPSDVILSSHRQVTFLEEQLDCWAVWKGTKDHGTALLIGDVDYDLRVLHRDRTKTEIAARSAIDKIRQTLTSFVDPYTDPAVRNVNAVEPKFDYVVRTITGTDARAIVGGEKRLRRSQVETMEHTIEGVIDAKGVFTGKVKAFGRWLEGPAVIPPPDDLTIPDRADTFLGPIDLFIASMEFNPSNTTHTVSEYQGFKALVDDYSGFLMFRDGLRVMPFGREDNDFFEIEFRRTKSAGREFWNHRQMFGRLAISRRLNPNLRDKAGREGLLDNRAAKVLREIVGNILMQSARLYFGSSSDLRQTLLPDIKAENLREKARGAREKLRKRMLRDLAAKLKNFRQELPKLAAEAAAPEVVVTIRNESTAIAAQRAVERLRERLSDLQLPAPPGDLGVLETDYRRYRNDLAEIGLQIRGLAERVEAELEAVVLAEPEVVLKDQISRAAQQVGSRLGALHEEAAALQREENARIRKIREERSGAFREAAGAVMHKLVAGELPLGEASRMVEELRSAQDRDNVELFESYIGALESLRDSIDLQSLATAGVQELAELRGELDRLNALAQLGVAVEIVGHELESYDEMLGAGLRRLPPEIRDGEAARDIAFAYEGLTDQLKFLSPLRLAGQRIQRWITGEEIAAYILEFFKIPLGRADVTLEASEAFRAFRVYDQPSRLLPVFINLVNNSIYWLSTGDVPEKRILFDCVDGRVVIADTGPGVAHDDLDSLFRLFFTRRTRGGRGVGLYLSRANLAAGGHRITYGSPDERLTQGANFIIEFRKGETGGR
jgi:signal transduction histidine kinase